MQIELSCLPGQFAICRLAPNVAIPQWAIQSEVYSLTRTAGELSVVCDQRLVPEGVTVERGWRGMQVKGPLDFSITGILAALAAPLAKAEISLFAISTFDTDYLLVRTAKFEQAIAVLRSAGFRIDND